MYLLISKIKSAQSKYQNNLEHGVIKNTSIVKNDDYYIIWLLLSVTNVNEMPKN